MEHLASSEEESGPKSTNTVYRNPAKTEMEIVVIAVKLQKEESNRNLLAILKQKLNGYSDGQQQPVLFCDVQYIS